MIETKKVFVFDIHGTLAESRQTVDIDMAGLLSIFLKKRKVAIVSGSTLNQMDNELLQPLKPYEEFFGNLTLFPSEATEIYVWKYAWWKIFEDKLNDEEIGKIFSVFEKVIRENSLPEAYGERLGVRGGQVIFSALGFKANLEAKKVWDGDTKKRQIIRDRLLKTIPEYDISIGGLTSISVNHKGAGKKASIPNLCRILDCTEEDIVYVGDGFYDMGDDLPVRETGVDCVEVSGPEHTKKLLKEWGCEIK